MILICEDDYDWYRFCGFRFFSWVCQPFIGSSVLIVLFHAPLWVYKIPYGSTIIIMVLKVKSQTNFSSPMEYSSFIGGLVGGVYEMRSDIRDIWEWK